MFACRLCGLTLDKIPDDAIQTGKIYRFSNGEYHDLRKKLARRTGPRPRKSTNTDHEVPTGTNGEPKSEEVPTQEFTEVPTPVVTIIPVNVPANETAMQRAFRLKKVA
jgi:hypothetical protein